jgi:fructosamine-3-kinase
MPCTVKGYERTGLMLTPELQEKVEKQIGQKIVSVSPLSAANTAQIYRVATDKKSTFVAKCADNGMDIEAWMLNYLKTKSKLPVPAVFYSDEHIILMEFINPHHSLDDNGHRHAAEVLAELHKIRADLYGLERDTIVGSLPQPNKQNKNWTEFFAQHRLLYMAGEALRENKIDKAMMKQIERLAGKLGNYIKNPAPPSLIHGDVWGGNILCGAGRVAAFLDPAIYYADPEIELAFIKLLNTFSETFFNRYNDINPIKPGFLEERVHIYSLYPLLVHTRLFGTSYARKAQKILDKFA